MKYFLLILALSAPVDISKTAKINSLKKKAAEAYQNEKFDQAIQHYTYLLDSMMIVDEAATLNLAHAFYQHGDSDNAQKRYQQLSLSKNEKLKSIAYQQLGAMSKDPQTLANAKSYFKAAIKADPTNEDARYNYELVSKKLKDQQDQNQQNQDQNQDNQNENDQDQNQENDQNQDQNKDNQDQQDQDQKGDQNQEQEQQDQQDQEGEENQEQEGQEQEQEGDQQEQEEQEGQESEEEQQQTEEQKGEQEEGEEGEENQEQQPPQPSTAEKLQDMNLTEEKAQMILEALKNSEIQYIQQNRRKPAKQKDSGKPDW